jgi:hypothetical protein
MFIDDGFTIDAALPKKGRLPALAFRYRPVMPEAAADYRLQFNRATEGKERVAAESKLIVDHLVSWDAKDKAGNAAPVRADLLAKVPDGRRAEIINEILWGIEKIEEAEKN